MRRLLVLVAAVTVLSAGLASSANAYGGGAGHDTWQVALSFNCDNPSFCGNDLGGFWGWVEFDRAGDGTITGDAQLTGCGHSVGGGGPEARVPATLTSTSRARTSALRSLAIRTTPAGRCSTWTVTSSRLRATDLRRRSRTTLISSATRAFRLSLGTTPTTRRLASQA
jgi:hypothetical protein